MATLTDITRDGPTQRGVYWAGTDFGCTVAKQQFIRELCTNDDFRVQYICIGKETCPTTGRPHVHIAIHFAGTERFSCLKTRISATANWQRAQHWDAWVKYCKKGGNFFEAGTPPKGRGQRTDIDALHAELQAGTDLAIISNNHFGLFLRYPSGITNYLRLNCAAVMRSAPLILWLYGETGTGKTRLCMEIVGRSPEKVYSLSSSTSGTWWNGYNGQKICLLDELRAAWMPHHMILKLLDSVGALYVIGCPRVITL